MTQTPAARTPAAARPTTGPIDTREMNLVHTYFRRETRLAGGLVRGVTPGDTRRSAVVADHLDMVGRHLHHHHTTEDTLLWPLLLERVPDELAPIVQLMESQHETVDHLQEEIAELLPAWRATAEDGERLAALYDTLHARLAEHLAAEEQQLLPIAARNLTQAEWDALGAAGREGTPRNEMTLTLGMFFYEGDPAVSEHLLDSAPPSVRWLVPKLAKRAFAKHATKVHGTPTP